MERRIAGGASLTLANGEVITINRGPGAAPARAAAEALTASGGRGGQAAGRPGRDMSAGATPNHGWDGLYQVAPPDGIYGPPAVLYERESIHALERPRP